MVQNEKSAQHRLSDEELEKVNGGNGIFDTDPDGDYDYDPNRRPLR